MSLIKKFQNISHRYDLWKRGDKIVVACSGGPDSACLLDVFAKLAPKYNLKLIVAHINYGLRGKDSDLDQKLVEKYASRYKLKLVVLKPKFFSRSSASSGRNDQKKPSFYNREMPSENELREIRYQFFEKVRKKNKFDYIAVGHTLDDQAETFLMRIIRGAGLAGMAAMRHKNGRIIRPLLGISRKEILDYLGRTDGTYRTDRTNKEITFLRNRIRNELIPLLAKKYNPNIKKVLYESSLTVADDYDLIAQITERVSQNVIPGLTRNPVNLSARNRGSKRLVLLDSRLRGNDNIVLNAKEVLKLHPALQKRIILEAIKKKKKNLKDIESAHINEIMKIIKSGKNKRQMVEFQGLKITRKGDKITIQKL